MSFASPQAKRQRTHQMRWLMIISAGVMLALSLVLMFLLTLATGNRELYERYYSRLFGLNVVVASLLGIVIAWMVVRLVVRLRQRKFGSRLLLKLAATFALVGFLPGLLIYGVSYQFVSRSIESWFDVKVEGALDAGLSLGRSTLDTLAADLGQKTRTAAAQINDVSDISLGLHLERIRDQLGADDVILWNTAGQPLASAGESRMNLTPQRPSAAQIRLLKMRSVVTDIDDLDAALAQGHGQARMRALVQVSSSGFGLLAEPRMLQVTKSLSPTLVNNALAVETAYREYQERALGREGLRSMYIGTLTLSLFLAMFGAVLLAVLLGNQLARPLLLLAAGVRDVAAGDLSPKPSLQGSDELEGLTRSFAQMTQQLLDARVAVDRSMTEVNTSRASLQTILDNITAGVMVLDRTGAIRTANPGATQILRVGLIEWQGHPLADIPGLDSFAQLVQQSFDSLLNEHSQQETDHWQQSLELYAVNGNPVAQVQQADQPVTLLIRGAVLPNLDCLLVFDDISEIVSAQRARAWAKWPAVWRTKSRIRSHPFSCLPNGWR